MDASHKNSYLQSFGQNIDPRVINRCVSLARDQEVIDGCDFLQPYNRLTSEQPFIPAQHVDVTRRPEAFGRWALRKLRTELHDVNPDVVMAAVYSLSDIVHDPEKGYEAIRLRIPDRLSDLLIHENFKIREIVCITLTNIAGLSDGKGVIITNKITLKNMKLLMNDECECVRHKNAGLIEMISRSWFGAYHLVQAGFIKCIMDKLLTEGDNILFIFLEALLSLMYGEGKDEVLKLGGFDIFLCLMENKAVHLASKAGDCFMMITSTYVGKKLAYDNNTLQKLTRILHFDNTDLYASAASGIMFCTIKSRAKIRASEMPHLLDRLVLLSNNFHNRRAQIFSIKALTNICEHPDVREVVKCKYIDHIEDIVVGCSEEVKRYKEILLSVIKLLPWS
ncbi:hypothetical protein FQA39_LY02168 [Lamprigera yunnana]|nr:hypothetical protein FQA39_LY02168 [Lamprigera yunnana]